MNAIRTKNSSKIINELIVRGGDVFDDKVSNHIFSEYYNYLLSLNQSSITLKHKLRFTYYFLCFLIDKHSTVSELSRDTFYSYISSISSLNWSLNYKARNKLYVKIFLNWAFNNNLSPLSGEMVLPKIVFYRNASIRTYYTIEEISRLLDAIDVTTPEGKEDFLIISMICFLGLRISDVINIKLNSVDFNQSIISLIQYKTKEPLVLPLIDEVKFPLLDYLKNVRPIDCELDFIFVSSTRPYKHKEELKNRSCKVKKYFLLAKVNIEGRKTGFHALRHSFSTSLLNQNIPLYSISKILGHTALGTTMGYLDIDTSKLKLLALEVPYVKLF